MKIKFPWAVRRERELPQLEEMLEETLTPVAPRQDFAAALQHRLLKAPHSPVVLHTESGSANSNGTIWWITALVGGVLIILTGFRAIAGIMAAIGLLGELGRRMKKEKAPSPSALSPAA